MAANPAVTNTHGTATGPTIERTMLMNQQLPGRRNRHTVAQRSAQPPPPRSTRASSPLISKTAGGRSP